MKNDLFRRLALPAQSRADFMVSAPQFVRPAANRSAARARAASATLNDLWTPHLLERLHAPVTRFRD